MGEFVGKAPAGDWSMPRLSEIGKYGPGENGLSGVGSRLDKSIEPEGECFQPKPSLGKAGNRRLAKRKKKLRSSRVKNFQLGWARNKYR